MVTKLSFKIHAVFTMNYVAILVLLAIGFEASIAFDQFSHSPNSIDSLDQPKGFGTAKYAVIIGEW